MIKALESEHRKYCDFYVLKLELVIKSCINEKHSKQYLFEVVLSLIMIRGIGVQL